LISPVVAPGALSGSAQPEIEVDGELLLRRWELRDARAALLAFSDPAIQHWHFRRLDTIDEAEEWIAATHAGWENETSASWAVVRRAGDEPVGRVALNRVDLADGQGQIAYWVLPEGRGKGVATRAASALAAWSLDALGLHRLELRHSVDNEASCRVAAGAGFEAEGTSRRALLHADGWHDMHLHARLRER